MSGFAVTTAIKRRGVDFHYEAVSDFSNQLGKYGATSDITFPIGANFVPPTQRGWLTGSWSMDIIGSPTYFVRGNMLYWLLAMTAAAVAAVA